MLPVSGSSNSSMIQTKNWLVMKIGQCVLWPKDGSNKKA